MPSLRSLWSILRGRAGPSSLAQRIALYTTVQVFAFVLLVGTGSWLLLWHAQQRAGEALLAKELELNASRIGARLHTIHDQLQKAARSSLIATALVDSAGKDAYLVPFLQGFRQVEGVPISVIFADFEGKEIARNGAPGITDAHFQWLGKELAKPDHAVAIFGTGENAELVVAEFVFYSRTKLPEGALLYRIAMRDLAGAGVRLTWNGATPPLPPTLPTRALDVPEELRPLGLRIALDNASSAQGPDFGPIAVLFLVAIVVAGCGAFWVSRRAALYLAGDLGRLSAFTRAVVASDLAGQRADAGETREVGELASAVNTMLDRISEQQERLKLESEAKFRRLVENLPGAAYRFAADREWTVDFISQGIEELSGYPAADFIGNHKRTLSGLIDPEDRDAVDLAVRDAIASDRPFVVECRIRRADGEICWVWARGRAFRESPDQPVYMNGVLVDITERKRAEQALREAKDTAESASRAKSQFLATVSHEIRTPLNGVLGMAELLLMPDLTDDERQEFARTVLNSGQTLLTLLNDILDLSRVEAGKLDLAHTDFDPAAVVTGTADLFREIAHSRALTLHATWSGPPGPHYRGDPLRLRQMLSNLVSNALKFTARGEIRIEGTLLSTDTGHARLRFAVSDTGEGIPAEKLPALFQPFSQLDGIETRRTGGSGLGLSIVRNLAELMGGKVGVDSVVGSGSTFWFEIEVEALDSLRINEL